MQRRKLHVPLPLLSCSFSYQRATHGTPSSIPARVGNVSGAMFRHMVEDGAAFARDVLQVKLHTVSDTTLSVRMDLPSKFWLARSHSQELLQNHCGVLAAVIDHTGGFCAWTALHRPGQLLSTVDLQVDFCAALVPADQGIAANASVVFDNSSLIHVDIECWNYTFTKRLAIGRAIYNVYEGKPAMRKLQAIFLSILRNNYFFTDLAMTRFREDVMKKHALIHYVKSFGAPRDTARVGVLDTSGITNSVIEFAERTDTHIRQVLGTKIYGISKGSLSLKQPYKELFIGNFVTPCLHGGVTAVLLEHCAQCCARTVVPNPADLKTESIRIDYLGPAPCFTDTIVDSILVDFNSDRMVIDLVYWNHDKTIKIALGRANLQVCNHICDIAK